MWWKYLWIHAIYMFFIVKNSHPLHRNSLEIHLLVCRMHKGRKDMIFIIINRKIYAHTYNPMHLCARETIRVKAKRKIAKAHTCMMQWLSGKCGKSNCSCSVALQTCKPLICAIMQGINDSIIIQLYGTHMCCFRFSQSIFFVMEILQLLKAEGLRISIKMSRLKAWWINGNFYVGF